MTIVKSQPAYARIRDEISTAISSGAITENAQLPTERDMCEQYGVSRITIRHALTLLEQDGLIRKRQGQGIFVCPLCYDQSISTLYDFADELKRQNAMPSWKVLSMELRSVSDDIAFRLGINERSLFCAITLLSFADGIPYAHELTYVPSVLIGDVSASEIEAEGLYSTIQRVHGLKPDRADESFEAILAPADVLTALSRKSPQSVMKITRVAYAGERALEYSTRHVLGDKFRFHTSISD